MVEKDQQPAQYDIIARWPPSEIFYIESMRFITENALRSADAVASALEETQGDFSRSDKQRATLNHLQNILVMAAGLSRYFWPSRAAHERRGEFLRERFKVSGSSPLKSRDLRNEIEHFDERLDVYLAKGIVGVIIPHYVGFSMTNDGVPAHLFRAYYVNTAIFEVLGKSYAIPPLVEEIRRIDALLNGSRASGGRLPH